MNIELVLNSVKLNKSLSMLDKDEIINSLSLLKEFNANNVFIVIKELKEIENEFNSLEIEKVIKLIEQSLN
jgi:UDP-N-acetylglucosamine pyrophosphorylase